MLDLPEVTIKEVAIKKVGSRVKEDIKVRQTTVLCQTDDCFHQLQEALLFVGMDAPQGKICSEEQVADALIEMPGSLIFVECQIDVVEQARALRSI